MKKSNKIFAQLKNTLYICAIINSILWRKRIKDIAKLFLLRITPPLAPQKVVVVCAKIFRFFYIGFSSLGFYPQKLRITIKDNTADLTPALCGTSQQGRKNYFISTVGQQSGCISLFCVLEFRSNLIFALNSLYLQL
jgi:hypothetical protein